VSPRRETLLTDTDLTVLVVDDYSDGVDTVVELLAASGFRTHAAHSSSAALDVAKAVEPDVVVLEPLMNDGGGWEVAAWLRRRGGEGPALVALTCGPCDRLDYRAAGFDYVVLKGDEPRTLVAAVALCAPRSEP
jgi:CheY-like chemotaxis protein